MNGPQMNLIGATARFRSDQDHASAVPYPLVAATGSPAGGERRHESRKLTHFTNEEANPRPDDSHTRPSLKPSVIYVVDTRLAEERRKTTGSCGGSEQLPLIITHTGRHKIYVPHNLIRFRAEPLLPSQGLFAATYLRGAAFAWFEPTLKDYWSQRPKKRKRSRFSRTFTILKINSNRYSAL
jgi:hypothetical protein